MTHNDNADRECGRRDEDSILAGCSDCIELVLASAWIHSLRLQPLPVAVAARRCWSLTRRLQGEA